MTTTPVPNTSLIALPLVFRRVTVSLCACQPESMQHFCIQRTAQHERYDIAECIEGEEE